jgi:hypothetical protein
MPSETPTKIGVKIASANTPAFVRDAGRISNSAAATMQPESTKIATILG